MGRDEWRDKVGDTEVQIVDEVCGELTNELGYGRLTDTEPQHPAMLRVAAANADAQLVA